MQVCTHPEHRETRPQESRGTYVDLLRDPNESRVMEGGTWKLEERSSSAWSSKTSKSVSSLMHAIFSISAAPLLMLRGSRERKNDLQSPPESSQSGLKLSFSGTLPTCVPHNQQDMLQEMPQGADIARCGGCAHLSINTPSGGL